MMKLATSNFILSAGDRKIKKNKIKQLYSTTQRNEKRRRTYLNPIYQMHTCCRRNYYRFWLRVGGQINS